jgi:outer membrane immunogenic protein
MGRLTKAYLLSTVSCLVIAGTAGAADMPVKAPPPPVILTWAGPYIGLNAGVLWHRWSFNDINNNLDLIPGPTGPTVFVNNVFWRDTGTAFTGGGQIGYNVQSGRFVYGIEADLNWSNASNDLSFPHPRLPFLGNVIGSTRMDWLATIRGRLGITMSPTLLYVTGGVAFAHVKDFYSTTLFLTSPGGGSVNTDRTLLGYAVGGGVEHRLSNDWSVKIEGLYVGLQNSTVSNVRASHTYRSEFRHSAATVRLGLNRRFAAGN